jgi:hypothetical protein
MGCTRPLSGKGSWGPILHPQPQAATSAPCALQSSSLCLWAISLVFCMAESVFAVRCAQLVHELLDLRPWWGKSSHHMVSPFHSPDSIFSGSPCWGTQAGWSHPFVQGPLYTLRIGAQVFSPGPKEEP